MWINIIGYSSPLKLFKIHHTMWKTQGVSSKEWNKTTHHRKADLY